MESRLPIIELQNLTTGYIKGVDVLNNVSMSVPEGTITCIIGANGAGKSTVLRTIFGFLRVRKGLIRLRGEDVSNWRPQEAIKRGLSFVAQGRCNFPNMSVKENLEVACYIRRDNKIADDIMLMMERFPLLLEKQSEKAGNLSGGQQQILEMAMGLINHPQLLLIDEPTLGLAPILLNEVFDNIVRIQKEGVSVLMVEQNAARALAISTYAFVLKL